MARKFCLMTMGRTGSTALVHALQPFDNVVLPSRCFADCEDEELIHRDFEESRRQQFSERLGMPLADSGALVDAFYQHYDHNDFVGFKSMPQYHSHYHRFVSRDDIFFITLTRKDLPSMVASFLLAKQHSTWRRNGEPVEHRWEFTTDSVHAIDGHVRYILRANDRLARIPSALRLTYEEISQPAFRSSTLDDFFGQSVRIASPRGATCASSYVVNWDEFCRFVDASVAQCLGQPVFIV